MKRVVTAAILASVTTAASWLVKRWLDARYARQERAPLRPLDGWENEGGALAPTTLPIETSQVPR
ncbi:MAG: hypothetical protein IT521_05030 [Burkholderiales bacterium]|nr:hypothetical protein [Burkholderiales bacterium]